MKIVIFSYWYPSFHIFRVFRCFFIKKEEYSREFLDKKAAEAKQQIAKYHTAGEHREMSNLLKWVLVFCKDELVYQEKIE